MPHDFTPKNSGSVWDQETCSVCGFHMDIHEDDVLDRANLWLKLPGHQCTLYMTQQLIKQLAYEISRLRGKYENRIQN